MRKGALSLFVLFEIVACLTVILFFWRREVHEKCPIEQIASRSGGFYAMPQDVLQSLLNLSLEEKADLSTVKLQPLEQRLLVCPALELVRMRKLAPNTLVVDYVLKEPLFRLGGYDNLAIDRKGSTFPVEPYFPSLILPKLLVPENSLSFIASHFEIFLLCLTIHDALHDMGLPLIEMDVRQSMALGLFRREVRLCCGKGEVMVRLPVEKTSLALKRLALLWKQYPNYVGTIDLRFPGVGYLDQFFSSQAMSTNL